MLARTDDSYLRAQARQARRRVALAVCAGVAALLLAAASLALPAFPARSTTATPLIVTLLAVPLAAVAASRATRRAARYRAGASGEESLESVLRQGLGDDYTLYRNLQLGVGGDLDAILLGPPGLVLLEAKAYRGAFVLFGDRWYRAEGGDPDQLTRWRTSPTLQARRNADRLARWLARQGLGETPVYSLVVLTSGYVREVRTRPGVPVVGLAQLVPYLQALPRARRLPREHWQALEAALDQLNI